ncbi:hypothetical protein [Texcoconibacillus texcoconensis]|uniref:Uncharacterized protein n=1 Tax=Texcoconibacillus texcoconensis TaxID=1095777 RepID=A0A840QNC1_9BACI|nr:hypothetical protein [Texcoconibacillus texcoconensis]MBB5172840.1 hypothetical protein [Texcoconibacillus texcoconensis]
MSKTTGRLIYITLSIISLGLFLYAIWLNQNAFANVIDETIFYVAFLCIIGLVGFELYKKTFLTRDLFASLTVTTLSIMFIALLVFPSFSYHDGKSVLEEDIDEEITFQDIGLSSFPIGERPSLFIDDYYLYSVKLNNDLAFFYVNPTNGHTQKFDASESDVSF